MKRGFLSTRPDERVTWKPSTVEARHTAIKKFLRAHCRRNYCSAASASEFAVAEKTRACSQNSHTIEVPPAFRSARAAHSMHIAAAVRAGVAQPLAALVCESAHLENGIL